MDLVNRFDVYLVRLDPTHGSEIKKTRPCLIISADEQNEYLNTIIIAPMTTTLRNYPTRISLTFGGKSGQVALDQIRCIDKLRLTKKLGRIEQRTAQKIMEVLVEMFTL